MIEEKVAVIVMNKGKKYRKLIMVNSDGSYDAVSRIVAEFVKKHWDGFNIDKFYWNYID